MAVDVKQRRIDWEGFPARLKARRLSVGLLRSEIEELTKDAGKGKVSARLMGDWERGTNRPAWGGPKLRAVAECLRVSIDDLIYEEEDTDGG